MTRTSLLASLLTFHRSGIELVSLGALGMLERGVPYCACDLWALRQCVAGLAAVEFDGTWIRFRRGVALDPPPGPV